jgi:hypothetical protein
MAFCFVRFCADFMVRKCFVCMWLSFLISFNLFQVNLKILQSGFWKILAKGRMITKRISFISGDLYSSDSNVL